ncbi:MAG: hypothetical protein LBQ79_00290 [Deltaproteobacteria bacterium]|jgi:hypothetical protein|nr:hypothetical protein [Deltaproteobacteria bacterium]
MTKRSRNTGSKLTVFAAAAAAVLIACGLSGRAEAQTGFFVNSPDGNSGISVDVGELFGAIANRGESSGGDTYYSSTTIINRGSGDGYQAPEPRRSRDSRYRDHRRPGKHRGPGLRGNHMHGHGGPGPKRHHDR